jgi:putative membrane protein
MQLRTSGQSRFSANNSKGNAMKIKTSILVAGLTAMLFHGTALAQSPAELNDLEIAHVAYVADNIDIRYAHLALAISQNPQIREFAETMIRDHSAVNEQALALLARLNASPQDNFLSQSLQANAEKLIDEMSQLRGSAFDLRYAENELAYHQAVNDLVENAFIPNIENVDVKQLFETGLEIFQVHENHASMMVEKIK